MSELKNNQNKNKTLFLKTSNLFLKLYPLFMLFTLSLSLSPAVCQFRAFRLQSILRSQQQGLSQRTLLSLTIPIRKNMPV